MRYLRLFEEMNIEEGEFPLDGHDLSPRERKILTDLVGDFLDRFNIKVEDHYYYTGVKNDNFRYNRFGDFKEFRDYILSRYYIYFNKPEEYLELLKTSKLDLNYQMIELINTSNTPMRYLKLFEEMSIPEILCPENGNLLTDHRVRSKIGEWRLNKYEEKYK